MYRESEVSQDVIDAQILEKDQYWQESLRINDEWNRLVGEERERRNRECFEDEARKAKERIVQLDEEKRTEQERIDEIIRKQQVSTIYYLF